MCSCVQEATEKAGGESSGREKEQEVQCGSVSTYCSSTNFCVYFIFVNFASRLVVAKIRSQNVVARCSRANQVLARSQN